MITHLRTALSTLIALLVLSGCGNASEPQATAPVAGSPPPGFTALSGLYLGQPPASYPTTFAASVISGALHTSPVFTPDLSTVYWSSQEPQIYSTRLEDGFWSQPRSVAFSASMSDYRDPFVSPSGDRVYFLSTQKLPGLPADKENIWFVEAAGDGWGEPRPLGDKVNAMTLHWQVSVAADRDLYFGSAEKGHEDIWVSRYLNDEYSTPTRLSASVNTDEIETTPYIAPDGSYLIFARLKDQRSDPRLFISYADEGGVWGKPVRIETVDYGLCPVVSPDGKYLFFLSSPESISWMGTGFIDELRAGG